MTSLDDPQWFWQYHPLLRYATHDVNIFREQIHYAPLAIEPGTVIFDVGAHIGAFALWALQFKPHSIYCYEPSTDNYNILIANAQQSNKVITTKRAAALTALEYQKTALHTPLYLNDENSGMHTLLSQADKKFEMVLVCPLFKEIEDLRPRFMKVDIEGYEYELEWQLLADSSVERFVVEYHFNVEGAKERADTMHQKIQHAGYTLYHGGDFTHPNQTLAFYKRGDND